jgi:hypothetical protein
MMVVKGCNGLPMTAVSVASGEAVCYCIKTLTLSLKSTASVADIRGGTRWVAALVRVHQG